MKPINQIIPEIDSDRIHLLAIGGLTIKEFGIFIY